MKSQISREKIRFAVAMCSTYINSHCLLKRHSLGLVISVTYDAKFCRCDLVLEVAIIHPHPTPKKSNFKSHDDLLPKVTYNLHF